MKARKVKGLDPEGPLADNARLMVRSRLDELCSFAPRALDPDERETLHDMRIAAKRLRYVLELTAPCFGPYAQRAAGHARKLQDAIGEVHDCDVLEPLILARLAALRAGDARALAARAGSADALTAAATARTPNATSYRALEVLAAFLAARRQLCFEEFRERWERLERNGFRKRLERALEQPPSASAPVPADPLPSQQTESA